MWHSSTRTDLDAQLDTSGQPKAMSPLLANGFSILHTSAVRHDLGEARHSSQPKPSLSGKVTSFEPTEADRVALSNIGGVFIATLVPAGYPLG